MSGPFGASPWGYNPSTSFYDYPIDQSLRFNDDDSAKLYFDPTSDGNKQVWTFSAWVKRGNLGLNYTVFFSGVNSSGHQTDIRFDSADKLRIVTATASLTMDFKTNRVFRDVGSWYHIVIAVDTTDATLLNRVKIYVNGVQETSLATTTCTQSTNCILNTASNQTTNVGALGYTTTVSKEFDGYMAEVHFVDGTQYAASNFGETKDGVWVPKQVSGLSYGTNGFYLSFADSAAIGDDLSGNTNDFTVINSVASDVVSDSPTNNFATFNPLDQSGTTLTYSEGNLKAERTSSSFAQAYSNFSFDSGKWYAEFLLDTGNSGVGVIAGTTNPGSNRYMGQDSYTYGYYFDGRKVNNASYTSYGDSYTTAADGSGDVVGVYIDADNGNIYFSKNGTVQNSGTAAFTGVTGPFRFAIASESNCFHIANFGQDDSFAGLKTSGSAAASDDNGNGVFYDAIGLSGYLAPCTANLPEPAIGPNSDTQADDNFNTVLYTGDGTSSNAITGVGFQPDWVWIKQRTDATSNQLLDVVRGVTKGLRSDLTDAEYTNTNTLTSFDSDGFTVGTANAVNGSSDSLVAWNWKAGGTAVSNTSGSITSSVSANQDAGFSIVTWTGTGANGTIGHGLSSAPELIICKRRDNGAGATSWKTGSEYLSGWNYRLILDGNSAESVEADVFNSTSPTSSVFSIGSDVSVNGSSGSQLAYCFHSVDGFSKVGTYTGNGSTNGTFVYTGFRPAWIMLKEYDGTASWYIFDTARDPENDGTSTNLQANSNTNEGSSTPGFDILSNGFKLRLTSGAINGSGDNYIYLAFAEAPFKYANAR